MRVLIADDDPPLRALLRAQLVRRGHEILEAEDGQGAIDLLANRGDQGPPDLVITDLRMPRVDGMEVVRFVREREPRTPVVILTAQGSIQECVAAMRAGAFNYLIKPFHATDLDAVLEQTVCANRTPAPEICPAKGGSRQPQLALLGESPALRAVLEMVERVAPNNATVLITGESGTGKEVVARLLHGASPRAGSPFVAVNCGAIPEGLIESELFGHARGAFTGATDARPGKFVQADGGTLFLDEVGELPVAMQVKLLRVLQDREVTPVGSAQARTVDVRIIAATNRDLESMVRSGCFRQDLFYRLEVVPLRLPPLRERRGDIPILAQHFLDAMNRRQQRNVALSEEALALMSIYPWPGNVREMENLFERLVVLNTSGTIGPADLPDRVRVGHATTQVSEVAARLHHGSIDLPGAMAVIESSLIDQALRQAGGNKTRAAELLGLSRTTLLDKLKRQS